MSSFELNTDQLECCFMLENWYTKQDKQVFSISGAGGTGKTTVIKFFIDQLGLDYDEVLFMTYMGKAANRLNQEGVPAKTIHSQIYDFERSYVRDEEGRLVFDEDGKPIKKFGFIKKEFIGHKIKLIVLDEASMIGEDIALDILSYGLPVVALGDLNQLPPVRDRVYFLSEPDYVLRQIMRQEEGNPVITLSQMVLNGQELKPSTLVSPDGKYVSHVIPKNQLNNAIIESADIVLTSTQADRYAFNNFIRRNIIQCPDVTQLYKGETIICRKNNWQIAPVNDCYLTNGMSGYVDVLRAQNRRKTGTIRLNFRPDFLRKCFKDILIDRERLFANPAELERDKLDYNLRKQGNQFEFGYAITVHLSQGSQWDNVLLILDDWAKFSHISTQLIYTGITRASKSVTIVV